MKKSPFGYILDEEKQIDSYGVDHSKFSLRDELAYQIARTNQEEQLEKSYNNLGISKNYPQFGNSFWGGNSANNYGFGTSNIEDNVAQVQSRPLVPLTEEQKAKSRGLWRNLDGVAGEALKGFGKGAIYGATRPLNGASFGALDWADRQLGGNLTQLGQEIQQDTDLAGMGTLNKYINNGLELAGSAVAIGNNPVSRYGIGTAENAYNSYKIGRAYDRLQQNPFQGSGQDVIARMKNHEGKNIVLQRGEVSRDTNGNIIASGGNSFLRQTGTKSNYGLNKAIYKHNVPKEQVTKIPKIIKQKPVETNKFGQDVYLYKTQKGNVKVVTSPTEKYKILSSMYKVDR